MSTNAADAAANRAKNEEATPHLTSIRPSFIVKDLQTSIAYYRERLGFQLDFQGPDDGPFWAGVSRDGSASCSKPSRPMCCPVQTTLDTSGLLQMRTSTAWTLMRSSTSSAGAVRHSLRSCRL